MEKTTICRCGHYAHEPGKCGAKVMVEGGGAHPLPCPCSDACPSCGHPAHFPDVCSVRAKFDGDRVVGVNCDCRHSEALKPLKKEEAVNHPSHYTQHPSGVECITIVQWFNFNIGNAIKYLWRAGLKGGEGKKLEDLQKAKKCIEFEIEREMKRS